MQDDRARPITVFLGASNLTMGLPALVREARARLDVPVDVIAAIGHGRSYGKDSCVLGRTLPGILQCGLWAALERQRAADRPVYALISDIGNDIMYGVEPDRLFEWLDTCINRLREFDARITITGLPLPSLERTRKWQYHIVKAILFPGRRLAFDDAIGLAQRVHSGVSQIAESHNLPFPSHEARWYGFDPIHIRRRWHHEAFGRFMQEWFAPDANTPDAPLPLCFRDWLRIKTARAEKRWVLGIPRRRTQPCCTLTDGTTISWY